MICCFILMFLCYEHLTVPEGEKSILVSGYERAKTTVFSIFPPSMVGQRVELSSEPVTEPMKTPTPVPKKEETPPPTPPPKKEDTPTPSPKKASKKKTKSSTEAPKKGKGTK